MVYDYLNGKQITAVGNCGTHKDITISGTLQYDEYLERWVVVSAKGQISTIYYYTIRPNFPIEYSRNPTASEIKFGMGATHYKDFEPSQYLKTNGDFKIWLTCPIDGLRYYRN